MLTPPTQELPGTVYAKMLYHGAVIDVGAELNGLAYVDELDWFDVRAALPLGAAVRVRVAAVRDSRRFRFPLEVAVVSPDLSAFLKEPPPLYPPIHVFPDDTDAEVVSREAGRPWPPPRSAADIQREALLTKVGEVLAAAAAKRQEKKRSRRKSAGSEPEAESEAKDSVLDSITDSGRDSVKDAESESEDDEDEDDEDGEEKDGEAAEDDGEPEPEAEAEP